MPANRLVASLTPCGPSGRETRLSDVTFESCVKATLLSLIGIVVACGRSEVYEPALPNSAAPTNLEVVCPPPAPPPTQAISGQAALLQIWERSVDLAPDALGFDGQSNVLAHFVPPGGPSLLKTYDRLTGETLSSEPAPFGVLPIFERNGDEVALEVKSASSEMIVHHRPCGASAWTEISVPTSSCLFSGCSASFSPDGERLATWDDDQVNIIDLTSDKIVARLSAATISAAAWDRQGGLLLLLGLYGPQNLGGTFIGTNGHSLVLADIDAALHLEWSTDVAGLWSSWQDPLDPTFIETLPDGSILFNAAVKERGYWGASPVGAAPPLCTCDAAGDLFLAAAWPDGSPRWALDNASDDAAFSIAGSSGTIFRLVHSWTSPTLEALRDDGSIAAARSASEIGATILRISSMVALPGAVLVVSGRGPQFPSGRMLAYQLLAASQ